MRPGYGTRHPCIDRLIASATAIASERVTWPNGLDLVTTAYAEPIELIDDDLVRSVRCITRVGDGIVVCDTPDGEHIMPGGRREPGETFVDTAVREVHEETGWHLVRRSVRHLGLWHIEFLNPEMGDPALPRPDIVQVVLTGIATDRDVAPDALWKDTEGWELGSRVVPLTGIDALGLGAAQRAFLPIIGEQA